MHEDELMDELRDTIEGVMPKLKEEVAQEAIDKLHDILPVVQTLMTMKAPVEAPMETVTNVVYTIAHDTAAMLAWVPTSVNAFIANVFRIEISCVCHGNVALSELTSLADIIVGFADFIAADIMSLPNAESFLRELITTRSTMFVAAV